MSYVSFELFLNVVRVNNDPCMIIGNMKKIVVSLTDEIDEMLRRYIEETYNNRRGALSIVVEGAIKDFLIRNGVKPSSE